MFFFFFSFLFKFNISSSHFAPLPTRQSGGKAVFFWRSRCPSQKKSLKFPSEPHVVWSPMISQTLPLEVALLRAQLLDPSHPKVQVRSVAPSHARHWLKEQSLTLSSCPVQSRCVIRFYASQASCRLWGRLQMMEGLVYTVQVKSWAQCCIFFSFSFIRYSVQLICLDMFIHLQKFNS